MAASSRRIQEDDVVDLPVEQLKVVPSLRSQNIVPSLDMEKVSRQAPVCYVHRYEFDVRLVRNETDNGRLGFTLSTSASGLLVDALWSPSLITEWNAQHKGGFEVCVGDRIISVNGLFGKPNELLDQINTIGKGGTVRLRIQAERDGDSAEGVKDEARTEVEDLQRLHEAVEAAAAVNKDHTGSLLALREAVKDMAGELRRNIEELQAIDSKAEVQPVRA